GYAVLMMDPKSGVAIGLHHHEANPGEPFAENRTGLDHISFSVASREDLDAWAAWLDSLGIPNSGARDAADPMPFSTLVFRDPDTLRLDLIYFASGGCGGPPRPLPRSVRQQPREAEPAECGVVELGQRADPAARQGQHHQPVGVADRAVRVGYVQRE